MKNSIGTKWPFAKYEITEKIMLFNAKKKVESVI